MGLGISAAFSSQLVTPLPVSAVWSRSGQAGSVGQAPSIQLFNPAGSGALIRVKQVVVVGGSGAGLNSLFLTSRLLTGQGGGVVTAGVKNFLDSRKSGGFGDGTAPSPVLPAGIIQGVTFDNGGGPWFNNNGHPWMALQDAASRYPDTLPAGLVEIPLGEGNGVIVNGPAVGAGTTLTVYFLGTVE